MQYTKRASKSNICHPKVTCRSGDSLVATNYISSLVEYNFDNRAESCCASGVWILYTGHGYTSRAW